MKVVVSLTKASNETKTYLASRSHPQAFFLLRNDHSTASLRKAVEKMEHKRVLFEKFCGGEIGLSKRITTLPNRAKPDLVAASTGTESNIFGRRELHGAFDSEKSRYRPVGELASIVVKKSSGKERSSSVPSGSYRADVAEEQNTYSVGVLSGEHESKRIPHISIPPILETST